MAMIEKPLDNDIVAKIEARDRVARRMVWFLFAPSALLAAVLAAAFVTRQTALFKSEGVQIVIGVLFAACILYAATLGRQRFRRDVYVDASDPRIIRRRIDAHQRSWRFTLGSGIILTIPSFLGLGIGFNRLQHADRFLALGAGGMLIVITAFYLAPLVIGPGWLDRGLRDILNDEFMRDLRLRAMRLGYLITIAAVAAALIATLWRPELALASLVSALYAGFAIPALYYVIADWRASRYDG